jgi:hypothetical protein
MVPVDLPVKNVVENTRLANDRVKGEHYYDRRTDVAFPGGCSPESVAEYFVNDGITDPSVVDSLLGISDWYDYDRNCMEHPDGLPRYGSN